MQIKVTVGSPGDAKVDLLAVPVGKLEGKKNKKKTLPKNLVALDKHTGGAIARVIEQGDFSGNKGQTQIVYPSQGKTAKRVLLLGLGKPDELDANALRALAGRTVSAARGKEAKKIALIAPSAKGITAAETAHALSEGAILGDYRYDAFLTKKGKKKPARPQLTLSLLYTRLEKPAPVRAAVKRGAVLAESQNLARDLSNAPGNAMTPVELAKASVKMAREVGLKSRVMDVPELRRRKMGGILGVGQGSANPPRMIILEHKPRAASAGAKSKKKSPTLCLIGKGITFDSGGISIKPSPAMHEMKHDMSGAAAVFGAMRAIKLLDVPHHVVGLIAAAENLPSDTAYRPGDILKMHSGLTVEILNTDAEGRLVLADALAYANETYAPAAMIDLATLTGACMIALGDWASGLMGNHDELIEQVKEAGDRCGEIAWPLPLFDDHKKAMKGTISDLVNAGAGRSAGMSTAAGFLEAFVGDTPWVHLDIAGTGWTSRTTPYQGKGATGVGVRLLLDLLEHWKAPGKSSA